MTECSMKLSQGRKKRAPPPGLASPDDLASFQLLGAQPLHKTGKVPVFQSQDRSYFGLQPTHSRRVTRCRDTTWQPPRAALMIQPHLQSSELCGAAFCGCRG